MSKNSERWSATERFRLLRYTTLEVNELSKELEDRTKIAIKSMARKLNMGECYVQTKEEISHRRFCNDCRFNKNECNKSIKECLKEANLYKQYTNIDYNMLDFEDIKFNKIKANNNKIELEQQRIEGEGFEYDN